MSVSVRAAVIAVCVVLLGAAAANPAGATGPKTTVEAVAECDGVAAVTVTNVGHTPARHVVTVDGADALDHVIPAGESVTWSGVAVGEVTVYRVTAGRRVPVGTPYTWSAPTDRNCAAPDVVATPGDCDTAAQTVTVTNPDGNPLPMSVRFDERDPVDVAPGESVTHTAAAVITVTVDDGPLLTFGYTPPTSCPTPTPSPAPSSPAPSVSPAPSSPAPSVSTSPAAGALPVTGSSPVPILAAGAVLIAVGVFVLAGLRARRRRFVADDVDGV